MRSIRVVLCAGLLLALLTSCGGAGSVAQNNASRDTGGEATAPEAAQTVEETAEPAAPTTPEEGSVVEDGPQPSANTVSSPAVGANGMVSSAHPLATKAGLNILEEGGNAFDAAVAVGAALNVVEPYMSGVGGYGATVIYDAKTGETYFLEPGSRTPANLDPSIYRAPTPNFAQNRCGATAVSTPGVLNAWETMWKEYGDLDWDRLFDPAVELAEGGFYVGDIAGGWIDAAYPYMPANAQEIYGRGGVPLRSGDLLVQKDLGNSMRLIAGEGAKAMYNGQLGEAIATAVQQDGGSLSTEDLRNNRARWRETVSLDHRGYEVVTATPPSTAWSALQRLGAMGQFGLDTSEHNSTAYLHAFAEVSKQAGIASRDYVADPDIAQTPLDLLLSDGFLADIAGSVNPNVTAPAAQNAPFNTAPSNCPPQSYATRGTTSPGPQEDSQSQSSPQSHTSHFVVADKQGNVVSSTQTIGNIFGSKVMPEGTGIWLNDQLAWNRFEPAGNVFDTFPGRQSLYALCPTIVLGSGGKPVEAIGTPGGRTIPQTTPQMLMNTIDFGMDIQQAIAAPRVSTTAPDALVVEEGIPPSTRAGLSSLGHNVKVEERGLGNAHGLIIEYGSDGRPGRFEGGSDPRGEGSAEGY